MVKVHVIETGKFKLDGGAMFGVVPKTLWAKLNPPDENNMCQWSMRCLLVQDGSRNILIDAGIGLKQDPKFRSHFSPENIITFDDELHKLGLTTSDITDVLLTHLHFDHCGGVLKLDEAGKIIPTFEKAKIWSNDYHYKWAINPNERERASFLKENILPMHDLGILNLIDVEQEINFSKNITLDFVYGHTGAMMLPNIKLDNGKKIIFCADLLPSHCHIGLPYVMAYDTNPLLTLKEKPALFEKANDGNTCLFLEHDKDIAAISIMKNDAGKIVMEQAIDLIEFCKNN
jgi:glyoxylase-like metal-dependent hydrolase (beta-lactamase superfamily II)